MDYDRYQIVRDIENHFECSGCPVGIKRTAILFDKEKSLPLLQVLLENQSDKVITGIYLKLVYYDNYGNVVPCGDKDYKLWGFLNIECPPEDTVGENKVVILPGTDVVDCDVFVTRIIYDDGTAEVINESDYTEVKKKADDEESENGGDEPVKKKKISGKAVLLIAVIGVALIYGLVAVGMIVFRNITTPTDNVSKIEELIRNKEYTTAVSKAKKLGDEELIGEIAAEAYEYYRSSGEYLFAADFANEMPVAADRASCFADLVSELVSMENYNMAKAVSDKSGDQILKTEMIDSAIAFYSEKHDYASAVDFAEISGSEECRAQVYSSAIEYYVELGEYPMALEYAIKTGNMESYNNIYDAAILNYYNAGDFNNAALYIAKSGEHTSEAISQSLIDEIFGHADDSFILANLDAFYNTLSFARKQMFFRQVLDVYKEAVAITNANRVTGTSASTLSNVISIAIGEFHTVGLKTDGTVEATGQNTYGQCDTSKWSSIVAIDAGEKHTAGVRADGTVVACGYNTNYQCNVGEWTGIVDVACGSKHTVGLRGDGTVVACGSNMFGQCNVSEWTDIIAIACGDLHTVGLKSDGTVVATGNGSLGRCNVSGWTDIVAIDAGDTQTVGLRKNGTVVMCGRPYSGNCGDVSSWTDVKAVAAGSVCVIGLTSTGEILVTGDGAPRVSAMTNLLVP